jgi:predicted MFS family arabinose efflux permease
MLTVFGSLQYVGTLISPVLGMLGDRWGLRNVLAVMRFWYGLCSSILLALALTGHLQPSYVFVIAALSGLVRPSDIGIRSALVGATVPSGDLIAAMGISRTTQDSARVGSALVGVGFMAAFGIAVAYMAVAAIYTAGAFLTLMVDRKPRSIEHAAIPIAMQRVSPWRDLVEGLAYVWRTPRLLAAMSLAALVNLTAFPLTGGLMPYIARDVFHLDQQGFGVLVASFASGALIGSLALSIVGGRVRPARAMMATTVVWYLCLLAFVMSTSLPVAMLLLVVAGIAQSISMVTLAIILLRTSEERFRGRIMGVRMLAIYTLPLGLLVAGNIIPRLGYHATALIFVATGLALTIQIAVTWRADLIQRDAIGNAG